MDLWVEGQMSAMHLIALIEKLNAPAARFDVLIPSTAGGIYERVGKMKKK